MKQKIFVTGAAGFIGFHLCKKLIKNNFEVIALDNINSYYDVNLKKSRLKNLNKYAQERLVSFIFKEGSLEDKILLDDILKKFNPSIIIHLAAQAGVRYSIENPSAYIDSNIVGFQNILECARKSKIKHFIFASSSSVYGGNAKFPFSENDPVDHPVSLYAATKRSNELVAHTYSHLYQIPCTGLRFFTVYGPWGRPDMAPMIFTKNIIERKSIKIFNFGEMSRDFTYVDDISEAIYQLMDKIPEKNTLFDKKNPNPSNSWAPFRILNLGNNKKIKLMDFVEALENELKIKALKEFLPMQDGDVQNTISDTKLINSLINFKPDTKLVYGINKFINWYKSYYKIS